MAIKYVLHTGETTGPDGKPQWVDGDQLARLYGVPISECLILHADEEEALQDQIPADATHLFIRADGKYPQCF